MEYKYDKTRLCQCISRVTERRTYALLLAARQVGALLADLSHVAGRHQVEVALQAAHTHSRGVPVDGPCTFTMCKLRETKGGLMCEKARHQVMPLPLSIVRVHTHNARQKTKGITCARKSRLERPTPSVPLLVIGLAEQDVLLDGGLKDPRLLGHVGDGPAVVRKAGGRGRRHLAQHGTQETALALASPANDGNELPAVNLRSACVECGWCGCVSGVGV